MSDLDGPPQSFSMRPRRRASERTAHGRTDRWGAIREALDDLLAECEAIVEQGQATFDAPRSLTYRAGEAVIIHFGDLIKERMPADRRATIPADLHLPAVETTRNILSHNYRDADKTIIWSVVSEHIPRALRQILEANPL